MALETTGIPVASLHATDDTATIDCAGYGSVAIALSGTWTGTVTFEGSAAPGQWDALPLLSSGSSMSTSTANGTFTNGIGGLTGVRARFSTASSGTVVVNMRVAAAGGSVSITSVGGGSATAANQVLQLAQETATAGVLGTTADAAVGNANGTINAHVRYANSVWASVWDSLNNWLKVSIQNASIAVTQSGVWTIASGPTDTDDGTIAAGQASLPLSLPLPSVYNGANWVRQTGDATNGLDVDVTRMSALVAGSAIVGKVGIDQTTPGTTNLVAVSNFPTTVDTNSGNKSASTIRFVLATDQPTLTNSIPVTPAANSAINMAQVGGTNTVTAGVAGTQAVGGSVATNVAIGTNPINNGAQAISAENAAVTATRLVQLVADLTGKLIVLPYANPENFVSGAITSAMTGTTTTSLLAAPASGLRNYITQITVSSASTTVPTDILIQDGSGGTTLYVVPCPIGTGTGTGTSGGTYVFPTPLRQPTTATAIFCANVTTGSSTKVSASGYKGA